MTSESSLDGSNSLTLTSPLSSLRTTPDLDLIDPRILEQSYFGSDKRDLISGETLNASALARHPHDGGKIILDESITDAQTVCHLDTLHINDHDSEGREPGITRGTAAQSLSETNDHLQSCALDDSKEAHHDHVLARACSSNEGLRCSNAPCEVPPAPAGRETRARARAGHLVNATRAQSVSKARPQLTVSERRTLRELKNQNLT